MLRLPGSLRVGVSLALEMLSIPQEVGIPFMVPMACGTIPDDWKEGCAMGLLCVPGNAFLFPEAAGRAALS